MNHSASRFHNSSSEYHTSSLLEIDHNWTIVHWPEYLESVTAWRPEQLEGNSLWDARLWDEQEVPEPDSAIKSWLESGENAAEKPIILPLCNREGNLLYFEWYFKPRKLNDEAAQDGWIIQLHDITTYQNKMDELGRRVQREKLFMDISNRFINIPVSEIDFSIREALRRIGEFENVDRSYVFQRMHGNTMSNTHEWCAEGISSQKEELQGLSFEQFPWWMEHMYEHESIYIPNVDDMPEDARAEHKLLKSQSIQSLIAVPMISKQQVVGFLGFDAVRRTKTWPDETIELLFLVADALVQILERKQMHEELRQSEDRWEKLVYNHPEAVQISINGRIEYLNPAGAILYGAENPSELIGKSVYIFSNDNNRETIDRRLNALHAGHQLPKFTTSITGLDGKERIIEVHSVPIHYKGQAGVQSVVRDITKLRKNEKQLRESLREKETLLSEIHHRVKNNLAVISGLLELQAYNATQEDTIQTLQNSQARIQSMAMVHEKLYRSETLSRIRIDDYIEDLSNTILETFQSDHTDVMVDIQAEKVFLDIQQAVPLGLLINELIVNAVKHAFKNKEKGVIRIDLQPDETSENIAVSVCDNGIGLPEGFELEGNLSLGSSLIVTLAGQLNAELDYESEVDRGTCFSLAFPVQ